MKKKLLGYYDYTVVLTYAGMLFAVFGIWLALDSDFWNSLMCLMCAGVCDMFDGTVARTKERCESEKRFGVQIDSLCDLISFGVLPAVFVYMLSGRQAAVGAVAALYVLGALIRLAYFNVTEEERQSATDESRTSYLGVPVTTIAVLLPAAYLLYENGIMGNGVCFPLLLMLTAAGFVAPVEIRKPKIIGKIVLIVIGIAEAFSMFLFLGWGAV